MALDFGKSAPSRSRPLINLQLNPSKNFKFFGEMELCIRVLVGNDSDNDLWLDEIRSMNWHWAYDCLSLRTNCIRDLNNL